MFWKKGDQISVTFSGGANYVGQNCLICESDDSAVVIDCGIRPLPGSNWTYNPPPRLDILDDLLRKKKKTIGVITHAHLDHIGAIRELISRNIPIYISKDSLPFTRRYSDTLKIPQGYGFFIYDKNQVLENGNLEISFFPVQHSIPGSHAVLVKCGKKSILHTGDFRMNGMENSLEESRKTFQKIKDKAGKIDCLILNVLNIEMEGFTPREQLALDSIESIIGYANGRVIITFFSSNIRRMEEILKIAKKLHRTVGVSGRNMTDSYFQITGRLPFKYGDIILMSGSQGEDNSGLVLISNGEHRSLFLSHRDTVIFSSRGIPGNEEAIGKTVENLHRMGLKIIMHYGEAKRLNLFFKPEEAITHSSGHGYRGDQLDVSERLDPKMIIPFHATEEKCKMFQDFIGGNRTRHLKVGETLKI